MKPWPCRAVLFDLDGVLVDSTSYIEEQWRRWALSKGLRAEPFLEVCHGRRALETIRLAAPHLDAEAEIAAFQPDRSQDCPLNAVEGAARLLESLPEDSWAVATSGSRAEAVERLLRAGLPRPRTLIGAEDVLHGKPHPDVYLKAAASLGVAPVDCIVVEDAPPGIEAAHRAGMRVIGLTTTHQAAVLSADACVDSLIGLRVGRAENGPDDAAIELLVSDGERP